MWLRIFFFISILFSALVLGTGLAHVMALPNKIYLNKEDYFIVQQIYRGWSLLGAGFIISILSTIVLTIMLIGKRAMFFLSLSAFLCLVGSLAIFWFYTYPVNDLTNNWTSQPENWEELRKQWEYSHVVAGVLDMAAFVLLILAVLKPYKNGIFLHSKISEEEI